MANDTIMDYYNWAMNDASDPRTSKWLLMGSPWPVLVLTGLYLVIVTKGQQFMADKQAFQLKPVLIVYNFLLVVLSAYMFWEFFATSVLEMGNGFSLMCEPVDYSENPSAMRLAAVCWWYFFSKVIEFMDTIFFMLRKKNNQISFLHVYHHSSMVVLWWIGVRWIAGGAAYFSAMINCWIHILMYTYYLLSAFGDRFQKYLWWKKYMTKLQLLQFIVIMIHTCNGMYVNCGYPRVYMVALALYMVSHILLFSNFYYHTYKKKKPSRPEQNGYTPIKRD